MSNLDELKRLAEAAQTWTPFHFMAFREACTPATILAILRVVEAAELQAVYHPCDTIERLKDAVKALAALKENK